MVNKIRKAMDERDQGFTLIELLVVIIIIGILAAIAIPVFLNQRKKGVEASMKADLKNAATEVESATAANLNWVASADPVNVTAQFPDVKVSPGNTVWLYPPNSTELAASGAKGYCLTVENVDPQIRLFTYSSNNGGLLPQRDVVCAMLY